MEDNVYAKGFDIYTAVIVQRQKQSLATVEDCRERIRSDGFRGSMDIWGTFLLIY